MKKCCIWFAQWKMQLTTCFFRLMWKWSFKSAKHSKLNQMHDPFSRFNPSKTTLKRNSDQNVTPHATLHHARWNSVGLLQVPRPSFTQKVWVLTGIRARWVDILQWLKTQEACVIFQYRDVDGSTYLIFQQPATLVLNRKFIGYTWWNWCPERNEQIKMVKETPHSITPN